MPTPDIWRRDLLAGVRLELEEADRLWALQAFTGPKGEVTRKIVNMLVEAEASIASIRQKITNP